MNILLTGGAGFVGTNIAKALLNDDRVGLLRIVDNLSNGYIQNIESLNNHPKLEFVEGDISEFSFCEIAMKGIDLVSHQAALGSVPRSIINPIASNNANINGTLNIFTAAKNAGVKRVVFAASSSTYGDSAELPKTENVIGRPLSPYAVTKYVMELYADVFAKTYSLEYIGLRYFNIFGPHQSPNGAYAAVIPLFMDCVLNNTPPNINGDGSNSRDFTFVENAVQANLQALFVEDKNAVNQIYNIAFGQSTSLIDLFSYINEVAGKSIIPNHVENRLGDIPHSLANIDKAKTLLKYNPLISVKDGIKIAYEWYCKNQAYFK
jgi:UDP-N-acetylglucosamine/UDP-N-acetylgalactosamine 4-epimerase